jgi:hypothetical protein
MQSSPFLFPPPPPAVSPTAMPEGEGWGGGGEVRISRIAMILQNLIAGVSIRGGSVPQEVGVQSYALHTYIYCTSNSTMYTYNNLKRSAIIMEAGNS